jgi:thiol-disulfide isomerase/thioredoxin
MPTSPRFARSAACLLLACLTLAGCSEPEPVIESADAAKVMAAVQSADAPITLVNFWATWCAPCLEEFPAFVEIGREFDDEVDIVFVSMDFPEERESALAFVKEQGWNELSYLKDEPDNAFITAFHPDWTGALPATLVYGPGGELLEFWEGEVSHDELHAKVTRHLETLPRS